MKLQGKKIVLCFENTPVGLSRDVSINVDREMIETASPSSSDAKTYTPGRYSWSIDSAHLVGNFNQKELLGYLLNKTALDVSIETVTGTSSSDVITIEGTAYLKSFRMAAPLHGFATADCSFQGTGSLSNT